MAILVLAFLAPYNLLMMCSIFVLISHFVKVQRRQKLLQVEFHKTYLKRFGKISQIQKEHFCSMLIVVNICFA